MSKYLARVSEFCVVGPAASKLILRGYWGSSQLILRRILGFEPADPSYGGYWGSSQLILRRILRFEPADPTGILGFEPLILRRILGFEPADPGFETTYCGRQACVDSGVELVSGCLFSVVVVVLVVNSLFPSISSCFFINVG